MMHWAENGRLNDWIVRFGIRRLLRKRLKLQASAAHEQQALLTALRTGPMTVGVEKANEQHYEVPPKFFETVLGPRLKYSSSIFESGDDLAAAEVGALSKTCERASLANGQRILELGCGWGSLTVWMAEHYRDSEIVAVSNSAPQRQFIESQLAACGLNNVTVVTDDVANFAAQGQFDRVVSVEMFEHVRNHQMLMERVCDWLAPNGKLFVHIFCHRDYTYLFEDEGKDDWMAREFFTGGVMPSYDLLVEHAGPMRLDQRWKISGRHYEATSEAWLKRLDSQREQASEALASAGCVDVDVAIQRWRMFFMACAELFGYEAGDQWHVAHYQFSRP